MHLFAWPYNLKPWSYPSLLVTGILLALVPSFAPGRTGQRLVDTITTLCRFHAQPGAHACTPGPSRNRHTLLLQIVKEQPMRQPKLARILSG